jgi:hypothetical protein
VIFDGPIVSKGQRVEPLPHLGFQFDGVLVTHIREHITPGAAAYTEPAIISAETYKSVVAAYGFDANPRTTERGSSWLTATDQDHHVWPTEATGEEGPTDRVTIVRANLMDVADESTADAV